MNASMAARKARPAVVVIHPSTRIIPPRLFDAETPRSSICSSWSQIVPGPSTVCRQYSSARRVSVTLEVFDDVDQSVLTFDERIWQGSRLVEEDPSLIGGQSTGRPGPEGGPGRTEDTGSSHQTMGPTRCHPTAVLEECGERWVAEMVRPGSLLKGRDPSQTFDFEQSGDMLQLHQIVGQLVEMEMLDVFVDPFLECRSEGAHSISPNICSTLQGGRDRFQR